MHRSDADCVIWGDSCLSQSQTIHGTSIPKQEGEVWHKGPHPHLMLMLDYELGVRSSEKTPSWSVLLP